MERARLCKTCNERKPLVDFRVGNTQCNACKSERAKEYKTRAREAKDYTPDEIRELFRIKSLDKIQQHSK